MTVAGHLLLQGTVLPYAAWYFFAPPAPIVQKAVVAALILVLLVSSYLARHGPAAETPCPRPLRWPIPASNRRSEVV